MNLRSTSRWPFLIRRTLAAAVLAGVALGLPLTESFATTSTLVANHSAIADAIGLDSAGNFYISSFTNQVAKVTPAGAVSVLTTTMSGSTGLAVHESTGTLYVCGNGTGEIRTLPMTGGASSPFLSGVGGAGLTLNATQDTLYLAQYTFSQISRIALDGVDTLTPFVTIGTNGPVGITFANDGNLYVANFNNGKIKKVLPDGTISLLVRPPNTNTIGYLAHADGFLYATSFDGHQVWRVGLDGSTELLAGTGVPGSVDGPALQAQFNQPNGIATTVVGDTLNVWVTEFGSKNLRRIMRVDGVTSVSTAPRPGSGQVRLDAARPNPFRDATRLSFEIPSAQAVTLEVFDAAGRRVRQLANQRSYSAGTHTLRWDGRDDAGREATPGVYFYRVAADDGEDAQRVVRLR